jgi:hypothetical protein
MNNIQRWAYAVPFRCYCNNSCIVTNMSDNCAEQHDIDIDNEMDLLARM